MSAPVVGLLHPGAMGASVGAAARAGDARVLWASDGRSPATRERARAADLEDAGSLAAVLAESQVVVSVCPPDAAGEQLRAALEVGYRGIYVDANAIAPETSRSLAREAEAAGAGYVDGGIVGPPAHRPGSTRLYLSGARAGDVARVFEGSALEAIALEGGAGAASALKMCFASWTKGSAALLTAVRALAVAEDVEAGLLSEWARSLPDLPARSEAGARATAGKAWRFVGEMHEIAATYEAAGLPGGFHRAAAEVYARLEGFKDREPPELAAVVERLLGRT